MRKPQGVSTLATPVLKPQVPELKILAEDIGKLVDFGVDEKTVECLRKAGVHHVRDVVTRGKEKIREIWGMKSRYAQLESTLLSYGAKIPA